MMDGVAPVGQDEVLRLGRDEELDRPGQFGDARHDAVEARGQQYIAGLQARERERTGISSLKVGFNKVFGYYLEITNPHRDRVPADYERRQTLSGAERFVTPELKAYEAKVLGAEEGIAAREAQLVDALRICVAEAIARVSGAPSPTSPTARAMCGPRSMTASPSCSREAAIRSWSA